MFKKLFKEKTEEERLRAYYLKVCKKLPSKERKPFMDYVLGNIINVEIASEDEEMVEEYEGDKGSYEEDQDGDYDYESDDELDETIKEELDEEIEDNNVEVFNESLENREVLEDEEGFILKEDDELTDEETREIQNIEEEED